MTHARPFGPERAMSDVSQWLPAELRSLSDPQTAIPRMARDSRLTRLTENAARSLPTWHELLLRDARMLDDLPSQSVHLVLTSPP